MLYVQNNGDTNVTVTLYGYVKNPYPYFTWKLINEDSKQQFLFAIDDHSKNPYYYNMFTFSTTSDLSTQIVDPDGIIRYVLSGTNSMAPLPIPVGNYNYLVYEMTTQYDLDIDSAVGLVDNGILVVEPDPQVPNTYTGDDNVVYYTYKNI